ncbi:MAG: hypothetical protein KDC34_20560 [Saprospiraceae bacterium]|nr:hypothetical protein [Saprospiraceae bacterium]
MKKLILLSGFLFALNLGFSQAEYSLNEEVRSMSQGNENALVLSIETSDIKLIEKLWSDYMKDFGAKPKKLKGTDEVFSDDADIPGVGAGNTVDVYTLITEGAGEVDVMVWFNLGGAYLNSQMHPSRYEDAKRFMERFVLSVSKELVKEELKTEEERLKDLEKELDSLEKEKQKYQDDIAQAEETIRKAEEGIRDNESAQAARQGDISAQQKTIEAVKKRLKDLD